MRKRTSVGRICERERYEGGLRRSADSTPEAGEDLPANATGPQGPALHHFGQMAVLPTQLKTAIGQTDDKYEQEADRVADEIARVEGAGSRLPAQNQSNVASGDINIDSLHSTGEPLDEQARALMEPRFGHDFGRVRVHTDQKAAESARHFNALAYTLQNNIVFAAGQYTPRSRTGQRLLAHELTHVIQQTGGVGSKGFESTSEPTIQRQKAPPDPWSAVMNPYAGTDNEEFWQRGYHDGVANPTGDPQLPGPVSIDAVDAYREGFTAGQRSVGIPVQFNPDTERPEFKALETAETGMHVGEIGADALHVGKHVLDAATDVTAGLGGTSETVTMSGAITAGVGSLLLSALIFLICEEHEPAAKLNDPNTLAADLIEACEQMNCSDLFLPFCEALLPGASSASSHSGGGDAVLSAGYWHGNLHFDYPSALSEAIAHLEAEPESEGQCGVVHFAPKPHSVVEFFPTGPGSALSTPAPQR